MLLSWLRFGETPLDDRYLERAIAALDELDKAHDRHAKPAEPTEILDMLSTVAATLQVELPEEDGVMLYIAVLQDLPAHVLKQAMHEVMRTHTFRTLPLPAEFLGTTAAMQWKNESTWLRKLCKFHADKLQRRIDARKNQ